MPRVHDMLAAAFLQEGVSTCFSLLGDANMNWATRMADDGCTMIYVRREHCAVAAAAMTFKRKSGKVDVATTTCAPGLTQIITATGAAYHALPDVARMPTQIRDAFAQAIRERRPVVLGVPMDLQDKAWDAAPLPVPSPKRMRHVGPIPPNPDDIKCAATHLANAQKVVVMAGLGAVHAGPQAQALAKKLRGLLATTLPARGLFAEDESCLGIAGGFSTDLARDLLGQTDVVIAVGCSLAHHNADGGKLFGPAHVLKINSSGHCSYYFAQMPSCDLVAVPALVAKAKGVTLWDFPISDIVASPVMQRAHPANGYP